MVLAAALVDAETEMSTYHPELGHILPEIPLHKAREVCQIYLPSSWLLSTLLRFSTLRSFPLSDH